MLKHKQLERGHLRLCQRWQNKKEKQRMMVTRVRGVTTSSRPAWAGYSELTIILGN